MIQLRHKLLIYALRIFDLALLVITLGAILDIHGRQAGSFGVEQIFKEAYQPIDGLGIAMLAIGWICIFNALVRYDSNRFVALVPHLLDVLKASAAASFYLLMIAALFDFGRINNNVVAFFWLITSLVSVVSRLTMRWMLV